LSKLKEDRVRASQEGKERARTDLRGVEVVLDVVYPTVTTGDLLGGDHVLKVL
jgi:hypothetical protein